MNIFKKLMEAKAKQTNTSITDIEKLVLSPEFLESETFKKLVDTPIFQDKLTDILKPQFDEFYNSLNNLPSENKTVEVEKIKKTPEQILEQSLKKEKTNE